MFISLYHLPDIRSKTMHVENCAVFLPDLWPVPGI